ncbi:DUF6153 family protein [Geodermatophilus nigrescens]|uniref:DUF6153 family protein n=1 Tax=Geodermatophilus sp. FMUSA9-8 TaxID=3120155 RepID=UPI00300B64DD
MRRLLWVLLVLGGVFLMHGVAFLIGQQHPPGGAPAAHAAPGEARPVTALDPVTIPSMAGAPGTVVDDALPGPGEAPDHDAAGHLWSLCLAVLATVLVCVVLGRDPAPTASRDGPQRPRGRLGGPALRRPPDLSVLCLLRI